MSLLLGGGGLFGSNAKSVTTKVDFYYSVDTCSIQ